MTKAARTCFWCLQASALLLGCAGVHGGGSPSDGGGTGAGADGGPGASGGARPGATGGGGRADDVTPTPPPSCGITTHSAERLPPDVLIVLDRSLSMNDQVMPVMDLNGLLNCLLAGPCPSKWADMTKAIQASVSTSGNTIDWGLKFFPDDGACGVTDTAAVPVAPNNATAVNGAIAATQPGGATPTSAALASAGRYLMGLTDANPRYVVLATDGQPNCAGGNMGTADDAAAIAAVTSLAGAGIPVFVIGIATQGTADATLTSMAMAGGKARAATPPYYPVAVSADLVAALAAIGGQVVSCTFAIPPPPDPGNVAVDADGMRVPKDPSNGWQYGPGMTSIVLTGSWCANLQNGTLTTVQAKFACGTTIIP